MPIIALTILASSGSAVMSRTNDAVDLQSVKRKATQIAKAGITRAKVVDRQLHADGFQRVKRVDGGFGIYA